MGKVFHIVCKILKQPYLYLIIASVLFVIGMKEKYINIFGIIKNYLEKFIKKDFVLFSIMFLCPLFISVAVNIEHKIDDDMINLILVMVSILTALFFTYLSYFEEKKKKINDVGNYNLKIQQKRYYGETTAIASYEILISVLIMMCCFVYYTKKLSCFVSFIIYFLLFHLLINLLVLIKRYNTNII